MGASKEMIATAAAVFLLCLTAHQCTAQSPNCASLANSGDCSFYDCLSTKFQCTANDYPLAYGRKYCLRYASRSSCFTTGVSVHSLLLIPHLIYLLLLHHQTISNYIYHGQCMHMHGTRLLV